MNLTNLFKSIKNAIFPTKKSAEVAKSRLQFVISQERALRSGPEYLPLLQQDLIEVISKYVKLEKELINVEVNQVGDMLELNIALPEQA